MFWGEAGSSEDNASSSMGLSARSDSFLFTYLLKEISFFAYGNLFLFSESPKCTITAVYSLIHRGIASGSIKTAVL